MTIPLFIEAHYSDQKSIEDGSKSDERYELDNLQIGNRGDPTDHHSGGVVKCPRNDRTMQLFHPPVGHHDRGQKAAIRGEHNTNHPAA